MHSTPHSSLFMIVSAGEGTSSRGISFMHASMPSKLPERDNVRYLNKSAHRVALGADMRITSKRMTVGNPLVHDRYSAWVAAFTSHHGMVTNWGTTRLALWNSTTCILGSKLGSEGFALLIFRSLGWVKTINTYMNTVFSAEMYQYNSIHINSGVKSPNMLNSQLNFGPRYQL